MDFFQYEYWRLPAIVILQRHVRGEGINIFPMSARASGVFKEKDEQWWIVQIHVNRSDMNVSPP